MPLREAGKTSPSQKKAVHHAKQLLVGNSRGSERGAGVPVRMGLADCGPIQCWLLHEPFIHLAGMSARRHEVIVGSLKRLPVRRQMAVSANRRRL